MILGVSGGYDLDLNGNTISMGQSYRTRQLEHTRLAYNRPQFM